MLQPLESSQIQEPIGARIPSFLPEFYRNRFFSILNGKSKIASSTELQQAVDKYFPLYPLTPLTQLQVETLQSDITTHLSDVLEINKWKAFAGDTFLLPAGLPHPMRYLADIYSSTNILFCGDEAAELGRKLRFTPLTPQEKEILLTDPNFYASTRIAYENGEEPLLYNGTRHLCDEPRTAFRMDGKLYFDTYGFTVPKFKNLLLQIRTAQRKRQSDHLSGLDIGGSNGLGAYDAETLDPYLDVTNMTIDPELAFWPLRGGHAYQYAELMSKKEEERFDIIFSNMAFRYMRYRHIALENALRALRIGGIMQISFTSDYTFPGEDRAQTDRDINEQFDRMDMLCENGIIKFLPVRRNYYNAREEWAAGEQYIHGMVSLQKLASIR